jgi:hypothetical protein
VIVIRVVNPNKSAVGSVNLIVRRLGAYPQNLVGIAGRCHLRRGYFAVRRAAARDPGQLDELCSSAFVRPRAALVSDPTQPREPVVVSTAFASAIASERRWLDHRSGRWSQSPAFRYGRHFAAAMN